MNDRPGDARGWEPGSGPPPWVPTKKPTLPPTPLPAVDEAAASDGDYAKQNWRGAQQKKIVVPAAAGACSLIVVAMVALLYQRSKRVRAFRVGRVAAGVAAVPTSEYDGGGGGTAHAL